MRKRINEKDEGTLNVEVECVLRWALFSCGVARTS